MIKTICIIETLSGNTPTFLDFLDKHLNKKYILYINNYDEIEDLSAYENIIIGTYTWSTGKIPERLKKFFIDHHKELKGKNILAFGSGNSVYPKFCAAVDNLKIICEQSECKSFESVKFEQRFNTVNFTDLEIDEIKNKIIRFGRM